MVGEKTETTESELTNTELEIFILNFSRAGVISDWDDVVTFAVNMDFTFNEIEIMRHDENDNLPEMVRKFACTKSNKLSTQHKQFFDKLYYAVGECNAEGAYQAFLAGYGVTIDGKKCEKKDQIANGYNDIQKVIVKFISLLPSDITLSLLQFDKNYLEMNNFRNSTLSLINFLHKKLKQYGLSDFPSYLAKAMEDINQLHNFKRIISENPVLAILLPETTSM